jgi:hypothetical protein
MPASTACERSIAVNSIIIVNTIVDNIGIQYRYCQMLDWGSRLQRTGSACENESSLKDAAVTFKRDGRKVWMAGGELHQQIGV